MTQLALLISEAEWEVMRIIWTTPNCSQRYIVDTLTLTTDWSESTIKSLLTRLTVKGIITRDTTSRPFTHAANITLEESIITHLLRKFGQTCHTQWVTYLQQIIQEGCLSQDDCDLLIAQLQTLKQSAPQHVECCCPKGQCHHHPLNKEENIHETHAHS